MRDSMMAALQLRMQQQQQQDQSTLANAARQPIPGLTAPIGPGTAIPGVGMAPPQQPPIPTPGVPPQAFMASGPYGRQAAQMAGLLGQPQMGNHMMNPPGNIQTQQAGLLGAAPKGLRLPFYRPTGK